MNTIGERVSVLIKELKITRLQFAKDVGISSGNVTMICQDKAKPSAPTIKSICRTYNINEKWLTEGEGEMFTELSDDEELAYLFGKAVADGRDPTRKKLLKLVLHLTDKEIELVKQYAKILNEDDLNKE